MAVNKGELYHNPHPQCNRCDPEGRCPKGRQINVQEPCKFRKVPEPMQTSLLELALPKSGVAVGKILEQMDMRIRPVKKYPYFRLYAENKEAA
jgi:hypothetical protein